MSEPELPAEIAAAKAYEEFFVPSLFGSWAFLDRAPAHAAEVALLERVAGTQVAEALRAPFAQGDPDDLSRLIANAGIREATITTEVGVAPFSSIRFMVEADLRGWLPVMGVNLGEEQIQRTLHEAEHALGSYVTPSGAMVFDLSAHLVSGTTSSGG